MRLYTGSGKIHCRPISHTTCTLINLTLVCVAIHFPHLQYDIDPVFMKIVQGTGCFAAQEHQ